MFQKDQMEIVHLAIEQTYTDRMTVTEYGEERRGSMTYPKENVIIKNHPCRISFSAFAPTSRAESGDGAAQKTQTVKLFCAPELKIKAGSKIEVERLGTVTEYACSGEPAVYPTHQEIMLELFKGWA